MSGLKDRIRFIRVGSLDESELMPPDVHIFTTTKLPWVTIPEGDKAVDVFYDYNTTWSAESLERRKAMFDEAGIAMP